MHITHTLSIAICISHTHTHTHTVVAIKVTAVGPEGEAIEVAWLKPGATTPTIVKCTIPRGSAVSVRIGTNNPEGSCVAL